MPCADDGIAQVTAHAPHSRRHQEARVTEGVEEGADEALGLLPHEICGQSDELGLPLRSLCEGSPQARRRLRAQLRRGRGRVAEVDERHPVRPLDPRDVRARGVAALGVEIAGESRPLDLPMTASSELALIGIGRLCVFGLSWGNVLPMRLTG